MTLDRITIEHDVESIKRLAKAQWLILDAMLSDSPEDPDTVAALKQLTEEIEDKCVRIEATSTRSEEPETSP